MRMKDRITKLEHQPPAEVQTEWKLVTTIGGQGPITKLVNTSTGDEVTDASAVHEYSQKIKDSAKRGHIPVITVIMGKSQPMELGNGES